MNNTAPPPPHDARPLVHIAGLPFDVVDTAGAVSRLCQAMRDRRRLFLSTPNLNFLMTAQRDPAFKESVLRSDMSVADGMPIVWLARHQGTPLPERVAGASVFEALRRGDGQAVLQRPVRVFFFGGPTGVADKACSVLNVEHAAGGPMQCVGALCPGFGSVADMSTLQCCNRSMPVGRIFCGSPGRSQGQAWIMHNLAQLQVPVVSHLGAVVNFVAGQVGRAPLWMQRLGLEWLWRIKEEPTLFKRYRRDGWGFLGLWWRNI
ncbi:MAG: WecB/TagA/CpsF family glycosyltransferase [Comamonadaceae bacterium]|nr:WecB/TagA/CpsF family glycosyltransferase [Comamonadaceae bacterium]